jgi:hypothetical protein
MSFNDFLLQYISGDKVVFMTCIGKDVDGSRNGSWGRLVITAAPE